jgi:methionyl-tRNA synthetase
MDLINFADFEKLDFRAGKVISAEAPNWSEKLLVYKVDFGPIIGIRMVCSGIKQWIKPEELVNNIYPFLINLPERKMGQAVSQAMMLMIVPDNDAPIMVKLPTNTILGTVLR